MDEQTAQWWAEIKRRWAALDPPFLDVGARPRRGKVGQARRLALFHRQRGHCLYCDRPIFLEPVDEQGNLRCQCSRCQRTYAGIGYQERRAEHQRLMQAWLGEPIRVITYPQQPGERRLETRIYRRGEETRYIDGLMSASYDSKGFPEMRRPWDCVLAYLEHKTPIARGGSSTDENLAYACYRCNHRKGIRTEAEWRAYPHDAVSAVLGKGQDPQVLVPHVSRLEQSDPEGFEQFLRVRCREEVRQYARQGGSRPSDPRS